MKKNMSIGMAYSSYIESTGIEGGQLMSSAVSIANCFHLPLRQPDPAFNLPYS